MIITNRGETLDNVIPNSLLGLGQEKLISELIIDLIAADLDVFALDVGCHLSATIKFIDGELVMVSSRSIHNKDCSIAALTVFELSGLISTSVERQNKAIELVLERIMLLSSLSKRSGFVILILVPELIWNLPFETLKNLMTILRRNQGKLVFCQHHSNGNVEVVVV